MIWNQFAILNTLALIGCGPGTASAGAPAPEVKPDLAGDVRAVFAAKCARCHGPELSRPRSGFGHILDLRRLAADSEKIVPFKPAESGIWQQVQDGEMPPPNSPTGPLTAHEKEAIRAWIAAGAPAESSAPGKEMISLPPQEANEPPSLPILWRFLVWLGKFHLLVLHFPIALLVAAMVGESWSVWTGNRTPSPAVRFCLGLAAASAVPALALGWLFALDGHGSSGLLVLHRWLGTLAGVWAVALAGFAEADARRGVRSRSTRGLLFSGVLLVSIAAHFGGLMVHGKDFYNW
jgi:mono/diheme cytochrome c family protein